MLCHQVCQNPPTSIPTRLVLAHTLIKSLFERSQEACGLRDESQIPMSLDSQRSGASLGAEPQLGHGTDNNLPSGRPADAQPQIKEQSYVDSDQNFIQAFSGDFPATNARMVATESHQYDGWESMPLLANSAPIGPDPSLQGSPYAQSLAAAATAPGFNGAAAAAAAAPNSNIETYNDFTDWAVTTWAISCLKGRGWRGGRGAKWLPTFFSTTECWQVVGSSSTILNKSLRRTSYFEVWAKTLAIY